jgi:hypothetical protein
MPKRIYASAGILFAVFASATARASTYTSSVMLNNFGGTTCATCSVPDSDTTYQLFSATSGWLRFGSASNNPLPSFLLGIDPDFLTKYQVDSITINLKTLFAQGWSVGIGNGTTGTTYESLTLGAGNTTFQSGNIRVNTLTYSSGDPGFASALSSGFMFKLTKVGTSSAWLFNTRVVVNYSDLATTAAVPEPSALVPLLGVLGFAGLVRLRKRTLR